MAISGQRVCDVCALITIRKASAPITMDERIDGHWPIKGASVLRDACWRAAPVMSAVELGANEQRAQGSGS